MRPLNLDNVKPMEPGKFETFDPGVYPCIIKKVEDHPVAEYLTLELDIVAGKYEGFFDKPYYEKKPFAHSISLFYTENSLEEFAWNMSKITESNAGFDANAAIKAGQEQMLVGKVCGCIFACQEFLNTKTEEFEIGSSAQPKKLCSLQDIDNKAYTIDDATPIMLGRNQKLKQVKKRLEMNDSEAERWLKAYETGSKKPGAAKTAGVPAAVKQTDVYNGDIPFM